MISLEKFNVAPDDNFDWSIYENGYNGGGRLVPNKKVKTKNHQKVYCHEPYAQDLYDLYEGNLSGQTFTAKDSIKGSVYNVTNIRAVNDHEISLDSDSGMTSVVDLNKETQFLKSIGCDSIQTFINALKEDPDFKAALLENDMRAKVLDNNRVSIWEGARSKIEAEFFTQLNKITNGYIAHVVSVDYSDTGDSKKFCGYTVDIMGVKCFLPGSLAASGPIEDFESLLNTDVTVCIVNYSKQTQNFVVSYKKFLELTLPSRVENELSVGQDVFVKVTGTSKNGIFCIIKDSNGDYIFPSLMHRSTMSSDAEEMFDAGQYVKGDEFHAYIHKINWNDDSTFRIVIGDKSPLALKQETAESDSRVELDNDK